MAIIKRFKDNKPAEAYAGRAKEGIADLNAKANMSKVSTLNPSIGNLSKAAGEIPAKTSGVKQRGSGAATKGFTSRGPMA